MRTRGLAKQQANPVAQRSLELGTLQRAHESARRVFSNVRRKTIEAAAEPWFKAKSQADQAKGLVADTADPVFGLPHPAPLDADPAPDRVVDPHPKGVLRRGRGVLSHSVAAFPKSKANLPRRPKSLPG
jgi:hypothetical protein